MTFADRVLAEMSVLYAHARKLTRSRADGHDLAHDTFIRAIERQAQFQRDGAENNLRKWLCTIQRHLFFETRLKLQRREAHFSKLKWTDTQEPDGFAECALRDFNLSLTCLTTYQFTVLRMQVLGYTTQEITQATGMSKTAIWSLISKARVRLHDADVIDLQRNRA